LKCDVIQEIDDEDFIQEMDKYMQKYYMSPYSKKHDFILFSGNSNKELAQEVSINLKAPLGKVSIIKKENGESFINIHENVNNKNVIIIQSMSHPVSDHIIELLFLISALKRESAKNIIVMVPFFSYSRRTLKTPWASQLLVRLLEGLGADQIIMIELHTKHMTVSDRI
jgi:ribose-phosphate pyrophosphokinase